MIPTARMVNDHVVALPHRPDETRVLRNLGFDVPDPMPIHYQYPRVNGRFDPFEVQQTTATFLSMNNRAFCLNDMGTGKTNSALWAFDYLKSVKQAKRMLVVCPLSTMERTWGDAVFGTFPHLDAVVLYGSRERRLKLLKQDADVYIINIDGISIIAKELAKRQDINVIVVDELAMARNAQTERWKTLNEICNKQTARRVWGMTGSPTPNSPTDAWAQCRLITPDNPDVPRYFGRFKDSVMRQLTPFKWVARPTANDIVFGCMQPAIRFALDDCLDLPEQIVLTREVELTKEQDKAYKDMMTRLSTEVSGGQVLAVNEAVKANKLIQIACIKHGTPVLTGRGWVPIQLVNGADVVWDGVEWVRQKGAMYKGKRRTVNCYGLELTKEHKVLTVEGWKEAQEVLNDKSSNRLDRAKVRLPNGFTPRRDNAELQYTQGYLDVPVRLWKQSSTRQSKSSERASAECKALRVSTYADKSNARYDKNKAVSYLVEHEAALPQPKRQGLVQLWRSWNNSMRSLGGLIRSFLGRYGLWVRSGAHVGPEKQCVGVQQTELPLGDRLRTSEQHTEECVARHPCRAFNSRASREVLQHQTNYVVRSDKTVPLATATSTRTRAKSSVYDLVDCGPRNRFVCLGDDGVPTIVHNCGVVYGTNGENIIIPSKPRVDLVKEIIEESEGKVIVFVPLTGALNAIKAELEKDVTVEVVNGETSKSERDRIFGEFQTQVEPRVLLANAQTMSHGLTLTAATTIVWYAPVHSNEIYSQACARVRRPGQKKKTVIVHIAGTAMERTIYKRLAAKESMQGVLLDMVKENNGVEQ